MHPHTVDQDSTMDSRGALSSEAAEGLAAARSVMQAAIEDGAFPGASFGLLTAHGLWVESAGRQTYEPDSPAIVPQTRYDLASLTKVLATTAMAMLLWQEGKLDLDTCLGDLLPGFIIGQAKSRARMRVTVRMLLTHTSGLPAHVPYFESCSTQQRVFRAALHTPLEAEPGSTVEYSDSGFILLGKALEIVAKESLDSFGASRIFGPLGMTMTGFCPGPGERGAIPPTEADEAFRRGTVQGVVHDENCFVMGGISGHAGLFGTAGDVLRFARAMLGHAIPDTSRALFRPETVRQFTRCCDLPEGTTRALGWDTPSAVGSSAGTTFSPASFGHLGFTGTSLWIDPQRQIAAVLLTNRTFPSRENKKIQVVRPLFHNRLLERIKTLPPRGDNAH